jgi:hypothetical protein
MREYEAIAKVIQLYVDGARSGRSDDMKPAFHEDATIFGHDGPDLFAGPIQKLFDWDDENGPAPELQAGSELPPVSVRSIEWIWGRLRIP